MQHRVLGPLLTLVFMVGIAAPAEAVSRSKARQAVLRAVAKEYTSPTQIRVTCRSSGRCRVSFRASGRHCRDASVVVTRRLRVRRLNARCAPPPTSPPPTPSSAATPPAPSAREPLAQQQFALAYVRLGGESCDSGGLIRAWVPHVVRSVNAVNFRNPELVRWGVQVQLYTSGGWANYGGFSGWSRAFTTPFGYYQGPPTAPTAAWISDATNQGVQFVPLQTSSSGYFRVLHFVWWSALGATYYYEGGTCQFV